MGFFRFIISRHARLSMFVAVVFFAALSSYATLTARVRYTGSDPVATVIVADSIISLHTIRLDHYGEDYLQRINYVLNKINGHWYYYFPIGTPLVITPFVWLAKCFGLEPAKKWQMIQVYISSGVAFLTFVLLFFSARFFISGVSSLLVAILFWFGTSLSSTNATALWSHDFAVIFSLISIIIISRFSLGVSSIWESVPLSLSLFLGYLCRPTLSVFAALVMVFLFLKNRNASLVTGLCVLWMLSVFSLWSYSEFNSYLPAYYLPGRIPGGGDWLMAIYGNLLSPARGLFVYSSFILIFVFYWLLNKQRMEFGLLFFIIGIIWPVAHLLIISRFPHWYGGWCFGSRLMTDALPGIFLMVLHMFPRRFGGSFYGFFVFLMVPAAILSIFINTGQGLYNRNTYDWSEVANISENTRFLFDWRWPQFLASKERNERMVSESYIRR